MLLISYLYRIYKYLFTLSNITGDRPVRSIAICCWGSIISVKTWLKHLSNVSIGLSYVGGVSRILVDLMFFLI